MWKARRLVVQAAAEAGVQRFIMLSHLGANRSSAFPVLKAKGLAEKWVLESGVPYTIFEPMQFLAREINSANRFSSY
jgi:NADH dehydrogenase